MSAEAARSVERALIANARGAGLTLSIDSTMTTPWASVTFSGARHELVACCDTGPALERWIDALGDTEFDIRGHLVADARAGRIDRRDGTTRITIEILTLERA